MCLTSTQPNSVTLNPENVGFTGFPQSMDKEEMMFVHWFCWVNMSVRSWRQWSVSKSNLTRKKIPFDNQTWQWKIKHPLKWLVPWYPGWNHPSYHCARHIWSKFELWLQSEQQNQNRNYIPSSKLYHICTDCNIEMKNHENGNPLDFPYLC